MRRINYKKQEIEPDEIFLDSSNLPNFNQKKLEGHFEKPIKRKTIFALSLFCFFILVIFLYRAFNLQIIRGEKYLAKSEDNRLHSLPVFASRGIIKDRNGVVLVSNKVDLNSTSTLDVPYRVYTEDEGFSHILGYVGYPKKDKSGVFWRDEFVGKDGVEKVYNDILSGTPGKKLIETDALGKIVSENTVESGVPGQNINLTIDSKLQKELFKEVKSLALRGSFVGGSAVIMDINSGEILSMVSYPEYNSNKITNEGGLKEVSEYFTRKDTPLINRAFQGIYTPGSTVKPYMALAALEEGIIDANKSILSTGSISIKNRYGGPDTIFRDWKAHGYVNMKEALAASSDVYFYAIGGGYQDQKGLGIDKINTYMKRFGFGYETGIDLIGEKTGIVPNPEWKEKNFKDNKVWGIGNTYHTSIGQFGFQLTLLELVRAVSSIANNGTLVTPHVNKDLTDLKTEKTNIKQDNLDVVKAGMKMCVTSDARGACKTLRVAGVSVAGKSGTAQLGVHNEQVNSWMTGFFPTENPKYAFVVLMEKAPKTNTLGAGLVMGKVLAWIKTEAPEYLK